jgi:hypothetical protein
MSSHYVPPPGQHLGYQSPQPPPRKSRAGVIILAIVGGLLVLCCGGFSVYTLVGGDSSDPVSGPSTSSSPTPPPREKDGAAKAKVAECLNVYSLPAPTPTATTPASPSSQVVTATERIPCRPGSYEVLKRIGGTVDGAVCGGVPGATSQYVSDDPIGKSDDFVLCLKKR